MKRSLFLLIALAMAACGKKEAPVEMSGNPVVKGWYADPEGIIFGDEYWIYPTFSDIYTDDGSEPDYSAYPRTESINPLYDIQLHFDAFSSKDLVHWTKHENIIGKADIKWLKYALWAPCAVRHNDKYYLFFSGNDIQSDEQYGGIGVAVADKPQGPFRDAIGKPLIDKFHNGAQPIDQSVFRDDDGQWYMYYGGWRHCNVVKLSDDLLSVVPFDDGETYKEVTPENYVEGPFMIKRDGKYYFMWSEGDWTGPGYNVAYAIADSPFGPFERIGKILQADPEVAMGAGHHSIIRIPDTDEWYIVYHRRPLTTGKGTHRETCIDRMYFDENGYILPVRITFEGVSAKPLK